MSTMIKNNRPAADRGSVLPSLTNRWLKVNDSETGYRNVETGSAFQGAAIHDRSDSEKQSSDAVQTARGISEALDMQNAASANFFENRMLHEGDCPEVHFELSQGEPILIDRQAYSLPPGHHAQLLIHAHGEDAQYRNGRIFLHIAEDAQLDLMIVNHLGERAVNNLSVSLSMEDGASLHISDVEMGNGKSNLHIAGSLQGVDSEVYISTAYLAGKDAVLDLFYDLKLKGALSHATIDANGALLDRAYKSFRGTLDFLEGAYGAVADEQEFTILMSDNAHSVAVPLLLCHEDHVVGNHAASAGKLDEEMLFYLMSRGISRKEAEGLIVESRMIPTLDRIRNDGLRSELLQEIHETIVRGE